MIYSRWFLWSLAATNWLLLSYGHEQDIKIWFMIILPINCDIFKYQPIMPSCSLTSIFGKAFYSRVSPLWTFQTNILYFVKESFWIQLETSPAAEWTSEINILAYLNLTVALIIFEQRSLCSPFPPLERAGSAGQWWWLQGAGRWEWGW